MTAIGDHTESGASSRAARHALLPGWLLWSGIVGVVAGQVVHLSALDRQWLLWLHQRAWRGDDFWLFLTQMGDSAWVLLVLLSFCVFRPQHLAWLSRAWLLGAVVAPVLKRLWDTPRPLSVLDPALLQVVGQPAAGHHAMPSGHSLAAGTWVALWLCMLPDSRWGRLAKALALASGLAVGVSRVAVGAHWPGDVLTGWGLGLVLAAVAVWRESQRPWSPKLQGVWVWPVVLAVQALLVWVLWQQPWEGAGKQWANGLGLAVALVSALWWWRVRTGGRTERMHAD